MLIPPVLEVYVLWHPDDASGRWVAQWLLDHFHGTPFTGLVGGAVEVYLRSEGWEDVGGPPRPMPFMGELPNGLSGPAITAVVAVLGTHLARAVRDNDRWQAYVQEVADSRDAGDAGVFALRVDPAATDRSLLGELFQAPQRLPDECADDQAELCREVSQAIAQHIGDPMGETLQVFISHTKRHAPDDDPDRVTELVRMVKEVLEETRLVEFYDERNIQTSEDWKERLKEEAARSCLLMLRTDLYATREWCQREVLIAKRAGVPIVGLYAIGAREDRGSFLIDHVPTVQLPDAVDGGTRDAIRKAVNRLVDESLKRALWSHQERVLTELGFAWLPAQAPEPATLTPWLAQVRPPGDGETLMVLHPDPPLGPGEAEVVEEICELAGIHGRVEVLTPRTFSSRGGQT